MDSIIPFSPLEDTKELMPKSTLDEQKKLRKIHQRVIQAGEYPQDEDIQTVMERAKSYTMRAVDGLRIGNNILPIEMISTKEEMCEDLTVFFEKIRDYSRRLSSLGICDKDIEFYDLYKSFCNWLKMHEARIIQDPTLSKMVKEFNLSIMPDVDKKITSKLGLDVNTLSINEIWERFYQETRKEA